MSETFRHTDIFIPLNENKSPMSNLNSKDTSPQLLTDRSCKL